MVWIPGITRANQYVVVVFDEEEEPKAYCPNCQNVGVYNRLKSRILNKGEAKPPDSDDFKQCHECGEIALSPRLDNGKI